MVCAGLISVLVFPAVSLALLRRSQRTDSLQLPSGVAD
jgi:hypothetical protein